MMNRICVILTTAAALVCVLVLVTKDDSYALEDKVSLTQTVSDENTEIVVVRAENRLPYAINIGVGLALIGGAAAVCGFCVHELRKERFSPFDS